MLTENKWSERILTSKNPFAGSIVRSAWENFPDVESINGVLTTQVIEILQEVMQNNITKVMLVQGQPGIGKSHFISRLRRIADQGEFLFVAVKPISDVTTIFNHIYRETFTSLRKKPSNAHYTPMESLISNIVSRTLITELRKIESRKGLPKKIKNFIDILEKEYTLIFKLLEADTKSAEFFSSIAEKTKQSIEEKYPEVDLTFLNVLFKALDPELRPYSLRWLQGDDIPQEQLNALGVQTTINNDQIAQRVLHSIMTLSDRPILLCFDQLESIFDRFGDPVVLFAFFDTVMRLCNETPNTLVLLMCQVATWSEQIFPRISQAAIDRIEYMESLKTPSSDELYSLVKTRLDQLWAYYPYPPTSDIYPFTSEYLNCIGEREGWNPRSVIRVLANDIKTMRQQKNVVLIEECGEELPPPPVGSPDQIEEFVMKQVNLLITRFSDNIDDNPYSNRENYLEAGLFDLFKGCVDLEHKFQHHRITNVQFKTKNQHLDMIMSITKNDSEEHWGIEICNKENSSSFMAVLRRINNHLDQNLINRWIILRDKTLPIKKTWRKTNEIIESLKRRGGSIEYLDTETNAQLFTCKEILDESSAGDLVFNNTVVTRRILLPIIINKILPQITIIQTIFGMDDEIPPGRSSPTDHLTENIIQKAMGNMLVNMAKMFDDYSDRETEYRTAINELKLDNKVVIISDKGGQLVISQAPGEDIF